MRVLNIEGLIKHSLAIGAALTLAACGGSGSSDRSAIPGNGDNPPGIPVSNQNAPPVNAPYADYGTVLNILPPGQDDRGAVTGALPLPGGAELGQLLNQVGGLLGGIAPELRQALPVVAEKHFQDQLGMYESLVFSQPGLTDSDLSQYFKPEDMLAPDAPAYESQQTVGNGEFQATIKRERGHGVPHVFGDKRGDVFFGAGYVTASDRYFLLDVLRNAGRGQMSRFLGPADFQFDRDIARNAPYREADLTQQIDNLDERFGELGEQVRKDAIAFVAGLNNYRSKILNDPTLKPIEYTALGLQLRPFVPEDVVAIATLIQGIFASGGGGEADNVLLLQALQQQTGDAQTACELWRDLRAAKDPQSPVTTDLSFATQSPGAPDPDACPLLDGFASQYPKAAIFDPGSYQPYDYIKIAPCGQPFLPFPDCPAGNTLADAGNGNQRLALPPLMAATRTAAPLAPIHQRLRRLAGQESSHPIRPLSPEYARAIAGMRNAIKAVTGIKNHLPATTSNALLVGGEHTKSGHPIAVFGPQTSYFVPQLLVEISMQGGGIHTRGMTFAGLPYIVIGRGADFAWSATSGNSDITDVRVLRLCEDPRVTSPGSYMVNGECRDFDRIDEQWIAKWNLAAPSSITPGQDYSVRRNIIRTNPPQQYGPVFAFATVNGQPVALTTQRSTYFGELDATPPFVLANQNDIYDPQSFMDAFALQTGTFNWFYIDKDNIAYFHSGKYPKRAPGVHPDLPTWGDGSADWRGFLSQQDHPHEVNPSKGYFTSWNNRPARDWYAADANASYGPVYRVDSLNRRIKDVLDSGGQYTRAALVEDMEDAGTVDLRGQELLPQALKILQKGPLTGDEQAAVQVLRNWVEQPLSSRAMRRDRNNDGAYDDSNAVALMDAWYNPMIEAVLPQVVALEDADGKNVNLIDRDNPPGPMGSAYQTGYYGYLRRVFDMALGESPVPYRQLHCAGTGTLEDCRQALRSSLDTAIASLGGIGAMPYNPNESLDRVQHRAIGLGAVRAIHWINRPTFQQVVEFTRNRSTAQ